MSKSVFFNKNDLIGNSFTQKIKDTVNNYFGGKFRYGNIQLYIKTGILIKSFCLIYFLLVFMPVFLWIKLILAVLLGLNTALIGFNVMHDGAHGSYSSKKWVNEMMGYTINFLGANLFLWKKKHNVNHHTFTNVEGFDEDFKIPYLRVNDNQKRSWYHRYQHLYVIFLYLFTYISWLYYEDYKKFFSGYFRNNNKEKIIFWVSKITHLTFFIVIPWIFLSKSEFWMIVPIVYLSCGFLLSIVFQLAHVMPESSFPIPKNGKLEESYMIHQINTTSNFATKSKIITWLFGGLNFQIEHHLFPNISHVHYPQISMIVKNHCMENNIPYKVYDTFLGAVKAHFLYLKEMGS